jgi:hypothetical protein
MGVSLLFLGLVLGWLLVLSCVCGASRTVTVGLLGRVFHRLISL